MDFLKRFFSQKETTATKEELLAEGLCGNCWGNQEFDGKFRKLVKDRTKSNISSNMSEQKAFIEQFVEDHLTGIRLKNQGDHLTCPACKKTYS